MKTVYTMRNGDREPVGFAFVEDGRPALLTQMLILDNYRGQGHIEALLRLVCLEADRERKDIIIDCQILKLSEETDLKRFNCLALDFGFLVRDNTFLVRKYHKLTPIPWPEEY